MDIQVRGIFYYPETLILDILHVDGRVTRFTVTSETILRRIVEEFTDGGNVNYCTSNGVQ